MKIKPKNLVYYGVGIAGFFTIAYIITLIQIRNRNCELDLNEFGDYIGGIFNPIFTLLSTIAIAVLTYFIAIRDDDKAKESLEIQKKVTLIQLMQKAFDNLLVNLSQPRIRFFEFYHSRPEFQVVGMYQKNENQKKEIESFWMNVLGSLEIFNEQTHLFKDLIDSNEFKRLNELVKLDLRKLRSEEKNDKLNTDTISKYLVDKEKLCQTISDFIIKKF